MTITRLEYFEWIDANPEIVAEAKALYGDEPQKCERCDGTGEVEVFGGCDCPNCDGWHECPDCEGEPGQGTKIANWLMDQYHAQSKADDEKLSRLTIQLPARP